MEKKEFYPLQFLSAVGAGGISIIPFAFLQYTYYSGPGLISFNGIQFDGLSPFQSVLFPLLMGIMLLFGTVHLILSAQLFTRLFRWMRSPAYYQLKEDSLHNTTLVTPFISIGMTFNVFIAVVRFFVPLFHNHFQLLMAPALTLWSILWAAIIVKETGMLMSLFSRNFSLDKINFSWLLHPFALAMTTVTGTGLAAMANSPVISGIAAFLSFLSGSQTVFLFGLFFYHALKNQFNSESLPAPKGMPALLSPVPITTLLSISGFRLVHYFEKQFEFHMHWLAVLIVLGGFVFEFWYLGFGLSVMKEYFSRELNTGKFYTETWSLICPFVAFAVLGTFLYKIFIPNTGLYSLILLSAAVSVFLYAVIITRQILCKKQKEEKNLRPCAA